MGINIGALTAPFFTGLLAQQLGWHWGFGIGGVGMLIALITYRLLVHHKVEHLATLPKPMSNRFLVTLLGATLLIVGLFATACYHWGAEKILSYLTYMLGIAALGYFIFLFTNKGLTILDRKKMLVCGLLFAAATVFWAALEQQPLGLTLFIEDYVKRTWFGFTIPAAWFYSLNPLFIIFFAPLLSILLQRWSQATVSNYMLKAVISLLITTLSFTLLFCAARLIVTTHSNISPLWIVLIYLLQSIAELLISPVGLAAISLLAPRALQSQMMGFWFIAASLGNLISGKLGGGISPDKLNTMPQLFEQTSLWLLGSAIVLFLTIPLMKRWLAADQITSTSSVITQNN
jgi:POT family proton-dependent oligopeptide transporter